MAQFNIFDSLLRTNITSTTCRNCSHISVINILISNSKLITCQGYTFWQGSSTCPLIASILRYSDRFSMVLFVRISDRHRVSSTWKTNNTVTILTLIMSCSIRHFKLSIARYRLGCLIVIWCNDRNGCPVRYQTFWQGKAITVSSNACHISPTSLTVFAIVKCFCCIILLVTVGQIKLSSRSWYSNLHWTICLSYIRQTFQAS